MQQENGQKFLTTMNMDWKIRDECNRPVMRPHLGTFNLSWAETIWPTRYGGTQKPLRPWRKNL